MKIKLKEIGGVDDFLEAEEDYEGKMCVECTNPWDGDTNSGIGRSGAVRLTKDQARDLGGFLMSWADKP